MQFDGPPPKVFSRILEGLWWRLDRALTEEDVWISAMVPLIPLRAEWHYYRCLIIIPAQTLIAGSLDIIADAVTRVESGRCCI